MVVVREDIAFLGMVKTLLCEDSGFSLASGNRDNSYIYWQLFAMADRLNYLWDRILGELHGFDAEWTLRMYSILAQWVNIKSYGIDGIQGGSEHALKRAYGSDCIMICLDGSVLEHVTGSTQEIADYWYEQDGFGGDIDNFMRNYLRLNKGKLPFVCFVITKMDTMDPNLLKSTTLDRIIQRTFPDWFEGRTRNGGHIVAVCPISALGYEFMDGGPFKPVNAEKPLLAALKVVSKKAYGSLEGVRFYRDGKWIDESEL